MSLKRKNVQTVAQFPDEPGISKKICAARNHQFRRQARLSQSVNPAVHLAASPLPKPGKAPSGPGGPGNPRPAGAAGRHGYERPFAGGGRMGYLPGPAP